MIGTWRMPDDAGAKVRDVLDPAAIGVSPGLCFKIRTARRRAVSLNLPSFSLFLSIGSENAIGDVFWVGAPQFRPL